MSSSMGSSLAGSWGRMRSLVSPRADPDEADTILRSSREAAALPYVRWRPLVISMISLSMLALTALTPWGGSMASVVPLLCSAALSWAGLLFVLHANASASLVALVITIADLPIVAAWAVTTHESGERLSVLLAIMIIVAWLFGPAMTTMYLFASCATILAVWFGHDAWSPGTTLPDVLWIMIAGGVLSVLVACELERTMLSAVRQVRFSQSEALALAGMRQRLAADVSHELRTPLTSINGFIDTVLRDDIDVDSELAHALLEQARQGGDRLERLITNLLDVEQATLGSLRLVRTLHPLGSLLNAAIAAVPPTDRTIDVTFDRTIRPGSIVHVDGRRFVQIVRDLVANGLEHGSGTVSVRCSRRGSDLLLDVSDEGPGIPPEQEPHIFEPFTSFGEHVGATGIGLSVARSVAVAHGGRLEFHGRSGDSPHFFRVRIPCIDVSPAEEAAQH